MKWQMTKFIPSKSIFIDGNRIDNYIEDGTIHKPYKTINAAIVALSTITDPLVIYMAPTVYTETTDVILPNCPLVIYGNGATINNSGHTITFQNPNSARYNLFTTANIVYNNFATGARNMVIGGSITGNITANAYCEFIQCQLNGGLVTVGATGQVVLSICSPTSRFTSAGVLIFNGVNMNTGYAGYLVTSTAGILTMTNSIIFNTNTTISAGGISCNNAAPITAPNMIVNCSIISSGGNATHWGLYSGTAYTMYSKNNVASNPTIYSLYGTNLIPVSSDIIGGSIIMGLGSDATGDMYYRNAQTLLQRIPKGTDDQVLTMTSGLPSWGQTNINLANDRIYEGVDLSVKFATEIAGYASVWAWIQARIQAANFIGIHVGDYIPFSLSAGTVAGYTIAAQAFNAQIAGIDTYWGYGDTAIVHHIDFITKTCMNTAIQWQPNDNNNGTADQANPWLTSKLYAVLNGVNNYSTNAYNSVAHGVDASAGGILQLLPAALQNAIIQKRQLLESRYSVSGLLTSSNTWSWADMGKLWLPNEFEVYGSQVWSHVYSNGNAVQYPLFAGAAGYKGRLKTNSGGSRVYWWLSAAYSGVSTYACSVISNGTAIHVTCSSTGICVPLCFRIA